MCAVDLGYVVGVITKYVHFALAPFFLFCGLLVDHCFWFILWGGPPMGLLKTSAVVFKISRNYFG